MNKLYRRKSLFYCIIIFYRRKAHSEHSSEQEKKPFNSSLYTSTSSWFPISRLSFLFPYLIFILHTCHLSHYSNRTIARLPQILDIFYIYTQNAFFPFNSFWINNKRSEQKNRLYVTEIRHPALALPICPCTGNKAFFYF